MEVVLHILQEQLARVVLVVVEHTVLLEVLFPLKEQVTHLLQHLLKETMEVLVRIAPLMAVVEVVVPQLLVQMLPLLKVVMVVTEQIIQ